MHFKSISVSKSIAVNPHDTNVLVDADSSKVVCRGISVAVAGDVAWKDENGVSRIAKNLAAGIIHPITTNLIKSTGTTATGVVAYW